MTDKLRVIRFHSTDKATLSLVMLGDRVLCHGLEDEYRSIKVRGETRIPAGTYRLTLRTEGGFHQRYKRVTGHIGMIWVRDVPNFKYILWHKGNYERDTDGCLLLGQGDLKAMAVWNSAKTYGRVYRELAPMITSGKLTEVTYIDADR